MFTGRLGSDGRFVDERRIAGVDSLLTIVGRPEVAEVDIEVDRRGRGMAIGIAAGAAVGILIGNSRILCAERECFPLRAPVALALPIVGGLIGYRASNASSIVTIYRTP